MKKNIVLIFIVTVFILLGAVACTEIDPLGIANGVPEGYDPDAVVDNDWIYYAEGDNIKKMRLDGSEITAVFAPTYSSGSVWKILLDPVRRKLYIFEHMAAITNNIYQYNLDGTGETPIASEGTSDITDMSIDHINGYLYYIWNGGIRSVNLEDTTIKTDVYVGSMGSDLYVGSDFNGRVYYIEGTTFNEVDTSATSHSLTGVTAVSPMTISSSMDGSIIYYYDTSVIYKIDTSSEAGIGSIDPSMSMVGNMVLSAIGNKIYFYSDSGAIYKIYSISIDGSDTLNLILDNGSTYINTFDVLAK